MESQGLNGALIRGGITEMKTCMERYRFFIDPQIKSVHVGFRDQAIGKMK